MLPLSRYVSVLKAYKVTLELTLDNTYIKCILVCARPTLVSGILELLLVPADQHHDLRNTKPLSC